MDGTFSSRPFESVFSRSSEARFDLDSTLKRIARRAIAALDGSAGMIILWSRDSAATQNAVTIGLRGEQARLVEVQLSELRDYVAQLTTLGSSRKTTRIAPLSRQLGTLQHYLTMLPLLTDVGATGVIGVVRPAKELTEAEERILVAFADQAGLSVRNAALVELLCLEQERLRRVIEASTDGIAVADGNGRILSVNAAMERMCGQRRSLLLGHRIDEAMDIRPRHGDTGAHGLFGAASESDSVAEVEAVLRSRDGTLLTVLLSVVGPASDHGSKETFIIYVRNVTRLRELEELRSTFLSMTSHELQTPVAIIRAWSETLQRKYGSSDEMLAQALDAITKETDRLSRLIGNLLHVTRVEAGALPVRLVEVSLADLAQKVADRLAARSSRHQITIDFPEPFPLVSADPERIEEVLTNLVDNAIKYSPAGGRVSISGRVTPSTVEVNIADEGPGIPLGEQDKLFQRFYRAPGGTNKQTTGVGLGLYLVKAIVEAHGGRVWLDSEWGRGSTFHFSLPRGVGPALPQPDE